MPPEGGLRWGEDFSFALLLLTYGLNVLFLSGTQLSKLNSGWNNAYRKNWYEAMGVSERDGDVIKTFFKTKKFVQDQA